MWNYSSILPTWTWCRGHLSPLRFPWIELKFLSKCASKFGMLHFIDFVHCQELKTTIQYLTLHLWRIILYCIVLYCIVLYSRLSLQMFRNSLPVRPSWVGSNCILGPVMSPKQNVLLCYFTYNNRRCINSLTLNTFAASYLNTQGFNN